MITGVGPYQVCTALVIVENTHNFGGGTVQSLDEIRRARELTREHGVAMHLDGARLWNAHVATGVPLEDYGREFDTVSVCLSKGLGAPVGSVLVGGAEAIAEARIWRKRFGGGMRQAGILAAAGLWALEHHIDRLSVDHARARRAAEAMAEAAPAASTWRRSRRTSSSWTSPRPGGRPPASWLRRSPAASRLRRQPPGGAAGLAPRRRRRGDRHAIDVLTSLLSRGGQHTA